MDIKLIAMDLDGTALQNDHESFSPRLLRALEEAHRRGVAIAPVTGRQYGFLPRLLKEHPVWEDLAVLCNGGQVRRLGSGEVLHSLDVSKKAQWELLELARRHGLPVEFSSESVLYLTERSLELQKPWRVLDFHRNKILKKYGKLVDSLEPFCGDPERRIEKINLLCVPPELRDTVMEEMKEIPVSAVWASSSSLEITHPDATKGQGVQKLCRLLGIPMESVMALGDSGNDETMLRQAGLGVAMGNAPDFVKRNADAVTQSNTDDGAAIAVERFVLHENLAAMRL